MFQNLFQEVLVQVALCNLPAQQPKDYFIEVRLPET